MTGRAPVRRIVGTIVVAVVTVVLIGVSFLAGQRFRSPQWQEQGQVAAPIDVWVGVESRELAAERRMAGVAHRAEVRPLILPGANGVVVTQGFSAGDRLRTGFVAEIAGAPHFLLTGPLPLYRDLAAGDSGTDVTLLQRSLTRAGHPVPDSGTVGDLTLQAMSRLFASADYRLPRRDAPGNDANQPSTPAAPDSTPAPPQRARVAFIPHQQLHVLPTSQGVVTRVAAIGDQIGPETPVLSYRTGRDGVECTATPADADTLEVGAVVQVIGPRGSPVEARITAIGEFAQGADGSTAGRPVRAELVDPLEKSDLQDNDPVTVVRTVDASAGLVVPVTALRESDRGDFVIKRAGEQRVDVPVTVGTLSAGYAQVTGPLAAGDEVLVS